MLSYLYLLKRVLSCGEAHEDRTGVGTTSLFGAFWEHEFKYGFPLITTKRVTLRWVFEELRWFLSGSVDASDLQKEGVDIWDEWATEEQCAKFNRPVGNLGPVYGKQLRCFGDYSEKLVQVAARTASERSLQYQPPFPVQKETTWQLIEGVKSRDKQGHKYVEVQFGSGFTQTARYDQVQRGSLADPYCTTVCGVGYSGGLVCSTKEDRMLRACWTRMLHRCYLPSCKEYKYYGAKGVTVCARWHNLSCFVEDAKNLVGWWYKKNSNGFELDKDHYQSKIYSPETCIWLPKRLNVAYARRKPFVATSPDGETEYHISTQIFAEKHGLSSRRVSHCLAGKRKSHKGWTFAQCEDKGFGFSTPTDQVAELLDSINKNPGSRRLVTSMWNPGESTQVALPPCHTIWQVKCHGNREMSLHLYQRSCDAFLGLCYNIASYGLLLEMLCAVSGYKPRKLSISFGDLHIYRSHYDAVAEQLIRQPHTLPTVKVNVPNAGSPLDNLLAIRWKDIELTGYTHHPKIEAPVAV